jgi:hypothetical protein
MSRDDRRGRFHVRTVDGHSEYPTMYRDSGRVRRAPDSVGGSERENDPISARDITVQLAPGAGAKLMLAMKRYANPPTAKFPWDR